MFKQIGQQLFIDSTARFCTPRFETVDFSTVDVILISNTQTLTALPYVTEYTNFKGVIYATEPTIRMGRFVKFQNWILNSSILIVVFFFFFF